MSTKFYFYFSVFMPSRTNLCPSTYLQYTENDDNEQGGGMIFCGVLGVQQLLSAASRPFSRGWGRGSDPRSCCSMLNGQLVTAFSV